MNVVWNLNRADKTYTATINGVTFTIKKIVSDMGGAQVFAIKGSNGYDSWAVYLRIAKEIAMYKGSQS